MKGDDKDAIETKAEALVAGIREHRAAGLRAGRRRAGGDGARCRGASGGGGECRAAMQAGGKDDVRRRRVRRGQGQEAARL